MYINLDNYKTIIFDFGGVILNIDPELSMNAFRQIGGEKAIKQIDDSGILWQFEKGEISKEVLYQQMCQYLQKDISYNEFFKAWTALLLDYKPDRIEYIKKLCKTHRLLMLSNTNEIHFNYFSQKLFDEFNLKFTDMFNKVYLSHEMGMIKPDLDIYKKVIEEQYLIPEQTLFIEDTEVNAKAANELGIETLVIPRNSDFYDYFK